MRACHQRSLVGKQWKFISRGWKRTVLGNALIVVCVLSDVNFFPFSVSRSLAVALRALSERDRLSLRYTSPSVVCEVTPDCIYPNEDLL